MTALLPEADWYFDFISPYAYFSALQLDKLSTRVRLRYHPVLFAGLLNHWGQKGPAEISAKREWTYRWCTWWAQQHNIPFYLPAAHPFNPIPFLQLALAAGCEPAAIQTIFNAIWTTGGDAGDPALIINLAHRLNIDPARLQERIIKDELRAQTDQAIANGVFGVPTFRLHDQLFWGADSIDFVFAYLDDPMLFDSPEMRRASAIPIGKARM